MTTIYLRSTALILPIVQRFRYLQALGGDDLLNRTLEDFRVESAFDFPLRSDRKLRIFEDGFHQFSVFFDTIIDIHPESSKHDSDKPEKD